MINEFVVIQWLFVQEFMDNEGFYDNSHLINDEPLLTEYGNSAYFVRST